MEYRKLGASGFMVPRLTFGTGTFGGGNDFFKAGARATSRRRRGSSVSVLKPGLNMFDSADGYSNGMAGEILGQAVRDAAATSSSPPKAASAADRVPTRSATRATIS
jgi:aryl-alcohol dehydrogenase-like predicted oxidoreductase